MLLMVLMLALWLMILQMDELIADVTEYSSRFDNCWDFDRKYEKIIGKMLASLKWELLRIMFVFLFDFACGISFCAYEQTIWATCYTSLVRCFMSVVARTLERYLIQTAVWGSELISYRYLSYTCRCSFYCCSSSYWLRGMTFDKNVLQVNMHRLTNSNFRFGVALSRWRPWRHFTQRSAVTCQYIRSVCPAHMQQRPSVPGRTCYDSCECVVVTKKREDWKNWYLRASDVVNGECWRWFSVKFWNGKNLSTGR